GPPPAAMRKIGLPGLVETRIVPSFPQEPPSGEGVIASVRTDPPARSTRFSLASAKKPSDRPSGDQKGDDARSVPGTGCASGASNARTHSRGGPFDWAVKAIFSPSGEMASDGSLVGGVSISSRNSRAAGGARI